MKGPFEVELKVHTTDGDLRAVVGYTLAVGEYPTKKEIQTALAEVLAEVQKQIGEDWRLSNRNEFENAVLSERYDGQTPHFATKDGWD